MGSQRWPVGHRHRGGTNLEGTVGGRGWSSPAEVRWEVGHVAPAAHPAHVFQRLREQFTRSPQETDCAPTSSPVDENPLEGRGRAALVPPSTW